MHYFLTSARLGFREWTPDDLPLANALWGNVEVTRFIGGPYSSEKIQERLSKEIATQREDRIQYWPIFDLSSDGHVGCCGLRPYTRAQRTLEIGFHLLPIFWGQGLAKEAAQTTIGYAFEVLKVESLFAGHNPKNEISRQLLQRLGFKYTHDEFYAPTGLHHPSYLLTKEARGTSGV